MCSTNVRPVAHAHWTSAELSDSQESITNGGPMTPVQSRNALISVSLFFAMPYFRNRGAQYTVT